MSLLGGHTVQDPEIKFGYAVTGAIDPARVLANAGARPATCSSSPSRSAPASSAPRSSSTASIPALADAAVRSMRTLNRAAAEALQRVAAGAVHACTDVTGFGLLGHATEMAAASGVTMTHRGRHGPAVRRGAGDCRAEPVRRPGVEPGAFRPTASRSTPGVDPDLDDAAVTTRKPQADC